MNLLGPELVRDLVSLIERAEGGDAARVIVFTSADPGYVMSHVDLTRIAEYRAEAAKLTGEASISLLFRHLSTSRPVSVAQIEGRVRGAGSEFVLACDMRLAARESATLGPVRGDLAKSLIDRRHRHDRTRDCANERPPSLRPHHAN